MGHNVRFLSLQGTKSVALSGKLIPSQPLPEDARQRDQEPAKVVFLAFVEAESLFIQIPEKMKRLDAHVGALDHPLEKTPEVLQSVRVALVHEARAAANPRLVHLHLPARLHETSVLHREPDAVEHEPSGLLRHAKGAPKLARTDAVLGIGNQPQGDKPLVQLDGGVLKDGPYFHRELLPATTALPRRALLHETNLARFTVRARHPVRPALGNHCAQRVISSGEIRDCRVESFGKLRVHALKLRAERCCVK